MYARRVQRETLRFGHRGWLLDESFLFYDRETDSLWCQATGRAVLGPRQGEELERLPVVHTTWRVWRELHPETLVLRKPTERLAAYAEDAYARRYARLGTRFGLAICLESEQRLYPLEELSRTPVVHDEVGGVPVLVVYHAPSGTAVALDRRLDGQELRFEVFEVTETDVILAERGDGRRWSGLRGRTVDDGPVRALERLRVTQFTLANWPRHYPQGDVYTAP